MFDTHSVYAINKADRSAIICPSAVDSDIRLTCEDFSSEEEFDYWKKWSDKDYKIIENAGQNDDRCLSFDNQRGLQTPSAEDIFFAPYMAEEMTMQQKELLELITSSLTQTQYRRLWKVYAEKVPAIQVALDEGVTEPSVSESISRAKKKISKIFSETPYILPVF